MNEVTPVPIPNTAVKLVTAENSNGSPIVKIRVCHILYSSLAQLVERPAVNRQVVGSSPTRGASYTVDIWSTVFFYALKVQSLVPKLKLYNEKEVAVWNEIKLLYAKCNKYAKITDRTIMDSRIWNENYYRMHSQV